MNKTAQIALYILQETDNSIDCIRLVRLLAQKAQIDEASAKASILRLNFEGKIRISSDLQASLDVAECSANLKRIPQPEAA
jgi:hypothetical protein